MLKKRDLHEVPTLFELLIHPDVYPYVREKAKTSDEFYFLTKQAMEAEEHGQQISRTILDEYYHPIGTINLFDINHNCGFLATWIGQPYFGKGYNKVAKELFLDELFLELGIDAVFMKVRRTNIRSLKAVLKLPYASQANDAYLPVFKMINKADNIFDLFVITKESFASYKQFANNSTEVISSEGEGAS